ncbi:MAG: hypothetical protein AB7F89_09390, partial [Pirellulaceae bacterium]
LNIAAPVQNTGGDGFILLFAGGDLIIRDSLPEPFDANGQQIENPADPLQFFEIFVDGEGGVRGAAAGRVRIDDGDQNFAIVHTATGQMTNAPPIVEIETIDQGGSDVDALGRAFVRVTLGDATHLETNYHITIDWGDGEVESFPIPGTINPRRLPDFPGSTEVRFVSGNGAEGEYIFLHRYFENPNAENPSAPVPIRVDVRYDARASGNTAVDANRPDTGSPVFNGIRFFELGGQEVFTSLTDSFTVPGSGVFGFVKVVESVIVPVEARVAQVSTAAVSPAIYTPSFGVTDEYASASLETEVVAEYRVFMRVVDDVTHTEGSDIPLDESVLEDPVAIFRNRRFPNGHYRVYLEELRTRRIRLILDVHIYNGRVVPPNFREAVGEQRSSAPADASAVPSGANAARDPTIIPRAALAAFGGGRVSPAADARPATAWFESSDVALLAGRPKLSAEQPQSSTTGAREPEPASGRAAATAANAGTELDRGLDPAAGAAGLLAGGLVVRTHSGAAGPERPCISAIPRLTKAARRWRRWRGVEDAALPDDTRIAHGQATPRRVADSP